MSYCTSCGIEQNPQAKFCGGCGAQQQQQMVTLYFQEKKKPFNASAASITIDNQWKAATVKKQVIPAQVSAGYHTIVLQSRVGIIERSKNIYMPFTRDTTIIVRWNMIHGGLEADII